MTPPESGRWFADEIQPHEQALRAYLLKRFPHVADQDDLVQETYSRAVRERNAGRPATGKAWLFTVARNLAFDFLRRQRRRPVDAVEDMDRIAAVDCPSVAPGDTRDREARQQTLRDAIAALPSRCREVMTLRYVHGLRYKQIAERLGISPDTVRNHMIKGVRDCTGYVRERGMIGCGAETADRCAL